ncbi:MAG: pyridoxine 5'-phosphate synthase [Flavobacteriaceae bacterium]|jgi:pyridoxine 5-phosphate synthase|nr:pyridoxine 5'-phosphate synthase [Flavobacteriaceae bacterium]MDA9602432.1 pyridoxine 5'-phosphate synthase [Flavobacteriaceae bacterium]MDG1250532.1 pyridoxine 5'-phosphate synthase [Flavobacteriaceae bacterium]MDG1687032.1 pyridoxine 5'-phosphate synthase [Flavobacteriaceae bacterium]MDG2235110.1 pyridoxine 5'-phosphate synthase [Flavobacteriaceae bacterium]|tara:strand:+ start:1725 stop:2441 length:717 start_codon:yes stop_codon:yes gene_type:complete
MTALSVNINKVATLRNARGGTMPNLLEVTKDLQRYGAQGITVHPRPDQRHIRYEDVRSLPEILTTEFNVEGNPIPKFVDLVMKVKPAQVTLVPDAVDALTSNAGWDTIKNQDFLKEIIKKFQSEGIRTSIFIDPVLDQIEGAAATGTDRIELYTEAYAADYTRNREIAIAPYVAASERANELGLGINAGHDLNLDNLAYFAKRIPSLLEVSIGHALICESLYLGFENVIPMYLQRLSY